MVWYGIISTIQMKNGGWWAYVSENLLLFKSKPPSCILTCSHVRPVGDYFPSFCLALFYSIVEVFEDYAWFYLCWKIIIKHQLWEPYGNQVPLWVSCTHGEESLLAFWLNNLHCCSGFEESCWSCSNCRVVSEPVKCTAHEEHQHDRWRD